MLITERFKAHYSVISIFESFSFPNSVLVITSIIQRRSNCLKINDRSIIDQHSGLSCFFSIVSLLFTTWMKLIAILTLSLSLSFYLSGSLSLWTTIVFLLCQLWILLNNVMSLRKRVEWQKRFKIFSLCIVCLLCIIIQVMTPVSIRP